MILNRRAEQFSKQVLLLFFFLAPVLGYSLAWWVRFCSGVFVVTDFQHFREYSIPIAIVSIFWLLVFWAKEIHKPDINITLYRETSRILFASMLASIPPMALAFTYRGYFYSRLVMLLGIIFTGIISLFFKEIFKFILRKLVIKKIGVARKLIIGTGESARDVISAIRKSSFATAGLVGAIEVPNEKNIIDIPIIGKLEDLRNILINNRFDELILACESPNEEMILSIIYECRKEQIVFEIAPAFWHLLRGKIIVEELGNARVLAFHDIALKEWQRVVKRLVDFIIGSLLLIILSPLFILIGIAIKINSNGPIFHIQERIGRNGRKFKMYKFRSMYADAEKRLAELISKSDVNGPIFKMKHDPRITKVGRLLRRFSIDELPQLINVVKGEMSLVGPRPPLEREVIQYEKWQLRRVDVTPGMTGLWQVSGRSDLSFEKMVELDIYYIEHWSLWFDIKILLKTPFVVLTGKGSY